MNYCKLYARTFSRFTISKARSSVSNDSSTVPGNLSSVESSCYALHKPVMVNEVVSVLDPKPNQTLIDLTFGAGGHTRALLERCPHTQIFALDRDPEAYRLATELSHDSGGRVKPLLGKFSDLPTLLASGSANHKPPQFDGALIDCGVSSMQLDSADRGFSFSREGPLDMRMDGGRSEDVSARDVVNHMDEEGLCDVLTRYGEERRAQEISRAIVMARSRLGGIHSTQQLADVVTMALTGSERLDKLGRSSHVATKTFQALRIFINNELNELYNAINLLHSLIKPGGVCAVISFHSLEDRIVKRLFRGLDMDARFNMSLSDRRRHSQHRDEVIGIQSKCVPEVVRWQSVFGWRPLAPSRQEINTNARARSAKLRAARKLDILNSS